MKTLGIFFILGILLVSTVLAAEEDIDKINYLGEVEQYGCKLVTQSCATCSFVNVSIITKNETKVDNVAMSNSGAAWTYSYCNNGEIGRYDVVGFGDLEGDNTAFDAMFFNVTPSGLNLGLGFYFLILILSVGFIILGFYIQDNWVIVLGGMAMVFLGLFILFYGLDGFKDPIYTWGLGIITLMLGSYFGVRGGYEALMG